MKVVIIGGGSAVWTKNIISDFVHIPALHGSEIILVDIDESRLQLVNSLMQRMSDEMESNLHITSSMDRRTSLVGADYVIVQVAIGGVHVWQSDLDIPWDHYKIFQTVGDTSGPGGIFRAFRSIPFFLQLAKEMEELCPDAWMIQLTNPMTPICRALAKSSSIKVIGYCHGVDDSEKLLSELWQIPKQNVNIYAYGVNHFLFVKNLMINNEDGLHKLDEIEDKLLEHYPVLHELWKTFDSFPVNYPNHPCEFVPFYLQSRTDFGKQYLLDQRTANYSITNTLHQVDLLKFELESPAPLSIQRSREKIADIIEALETNKDLIVHVNMANQGAIANLPYDCNVEVPALVNKRGVFNMAMGALPKGTESLVRRIVDEQELIAEAGITGDYNLAIQALALDPLIHDIRIARKLFNLLLESQREYLPQFA